MFKKLTEFSYKRNWKEAIGFYLAYLLVGVILGFIAGGLYGMLNLSSHGANVSYSDGFNSGLGIGTIIAVIYCFVVTVILIKEKKLYKNFGYILLALLGIVLSVIGGGLFGLIVPAFMTTRANKNVQAK